MKWFRSIPQLKNIVETYPKLALYQTEFNELWNISYNSPFSVGYMLAILFAMSMLLLGWLRNDWNQELEYQQQATIIIMKAKPIRQYLQLGAERLFGKPLSTNVQHQISSAFQLEGIVYDKAVQKRSAVLKDASGEEKIYYIGDVLPGGAKLYNIDQGSIEIEYQGYRHQLKLKQYPSSFLSDKPLDSGTRIFKDKKE